ncbi:MAG: CpaF family protein [Acidimicrobiales bacterium]
MSSSVRSWLAEDAQLTPEQLTERLRRDVPAAEARGTNSEVHNTLRTMTGYGPLTRLLRSQAVNDICINGPGEVLVDADGGWHRSGIVLTAAELELMVERLLAPSGRRIDRLHPMVDAQLGDGSRINVVAAPVALDGPIVTIRRFKASGVALDSFGTTSQIEELRHALSNRRNVVVSGATGAGKTALVAALLNELPPTERLVVVEDTAEISVTSGSAVRMQTQPAVGEVGRQVSLRDLVRNALRMRPDRLIVGEVRGPEALDLLLALNTGHRGSLSTCHGSSCESVLERIALLAQLAGEVDVGAVRSMVRSSIDVVVHLERTGSERRISEIVDAQKASFAND